MYPPGERHDARLIDEYVRAEQRRLRPRQMDVYVAHWVMRQSVTMIAELEGAKWYTVTRRIQRLRAAARRWDRRRKQAAG